MECVLYCGRLCLSGLRVHTGQLTRCASGGSSFPNSSTMRSSSSLTGEPTSTTSSTSESDVSDTPSSDVAAGGFAGSFGTFQKALEPTPAAPRESKSFLTLLRQSQFVRLGKPIGTLVEGRVFHVVGDDLYIDFGGKFHCVCPRPSRRGEEYMVGSVVRLKLRDLELSSLFLGGKRDLTLLEADAIIVNLKSTPYKSAVSAGTRTVQS